MTDGRLRYEMGYRPEEFHDRLPAVAPVTFDAADMRFDHIDGDRSWSLWLRNPHERRIGLIRLPVIDVEFAFRGYPKGEADAILKRFFAYFQRGGG